MLQWRRDAVADSGRGALMQQQEQQIGGIPARMARAVAAIFARDGLAQHARKVQVLESLNSDFDRIPLADGAGAQTTIAEIINAAERAARACYAMCERFQTPDAIDAAIRAECQRRGVKYPVGEDLAEQIKRACDATWWRRVLRKEYTRRFEHTAIQVGMVGLRTDPYVTRETAIMQEMQNRANQKLLENRIATNEKGQSYSVADLAALGVGNKSIRRGELMARIRGLEEIAMMRGDVGMFWTITTPSKFHSVGGTNSKYQGATPRDAQAYLCKVWAKIRAAFKRQDMQPYGFRIAEPHTDGCPHWHMLFFVGKNETARMEQIIRAYALAEDGDERGAAENRVKLVNIEAGRGSAAGYILKYVCKNIDGAGVGDHKVFESGRTYIVAPDIFGDLEITPSARVTYWSQVWGIRQFQQIGGADVGTWRELRRIKAETVRNAPEAIRAAWLACQKIESTDERVAKQASFADYVMAQGGPTVGRRTAIKIAAKEVTVTGKYATYEAKKPVGVYATVQPNAVYESVRYQWTIGTKDGAGGGGLWGARTGVNNCTGRNNQTAKDTAAANAGKPVQGQKNSFNDPRRVRKSNEGGPGVAFDKWKRWSVEQDEARNEQYQDSKRGGASFDARHLEKLRGKNA